MVTKYDDLLLDYILNSGKSQSSLVQTIGTPKRPAKPIAVFPKVDPLLNYSIDLIKDKDNG